MVATTFLKYAVELPRAEGRGFDAAHVLLPLLAQLFLQSFESAQESCKNNPAVQEGPHA